MVTRILILTSALLLTGCATSSATTDRLDAMESKLTTVQNTADEALRLARQAQSDASGAASTARSAETAAQRALEAAQEASEKAERISATCCARK